MSKKTKPSPTNRITKRKAEAPMIIKREQVSIDHAQIAQLAFDKFVARGCAHGFHVDDWLAAEAELRAAAAADPS